MLVDGHADPHQGLGGGSNCRAEGWGGYGGCGRPTHRAEVSASHSYCRVVAELTSAAPQDPSGRHGFYEEWFGSVAPSGRVKPGHGAAFALRAPTGSARLARRGSRRVSSVIQRR
jgi:hypothetical protein